MVRPFCMSLSHHYFTNYDAICVRKDAYLCQVSYNKSIPFVGWK